MNVARGWPSFAWASHVLEPAKWSLARRYLVSHFTVVLAGVLVVGAWVGHQIGERVLQRTAGITALYVDSVVGPHLQTLALDDRWLVPADRDALDRLMSETGLGQGVVLFKVWSVDGRILYSPDRALIGQQFGADDALLRAGRGEVNADMSDLSQPENVHERQQFSRLVEVYAPVRRESGGQVIAVNEFYLLPDALDAEIGAAQLRSWGVVGVVGVITYLLMAGIVKSGSDTIRRQQGELQGQVGELRELLGQNARLQERVRLAAGRTTTLNEQALRRISADLHDGPGQALALALLRLDSLESSVDARSPDFATVHGAVRDALNEVRSISAGLRLPELGPLELSAVAERAIGTHIDRQLGRLPRCAPLEIKIALLRTLQESLSNASRHGAGQDVAVDLKMDRDGLLLEVADSGPGFDLNALATSRGLGLAGMRERAQLLGGSFQVESRPGSGTRVRVRWPLLSAAQT